MGHLQHVKVAVAIPRFERLDGRRHQEIAMPRLANALAARAVADAFALVQRVGHVIGESGLIEDPLGLRSGERGYRQEQKGNAQFPVHPGALELDHYRQHSGPIRHARHGGHRRMRRGDPVDLLAAVSLRIRHRPQDGGQHHARAVDAGQDPVQDDGPARPGPRDLGRADGEVGRGEVQACGRYAQSAMQLAAGRAAISAGGAVGSDQRGDQRSQGYQPEALMDFEHVRALVEPRLIRCASLGLIRRDAQILQRRRRLVSRRRRWLTAALGASRLGHQRRRQ